MAFKHSKKRNVGVALDLLVRGAARRLAEGDHEGADRALSLASKWFKFGSELEKERKIFSALCEAHVSSQTAALAILREAKVSVCNLLEDKLDAERSKMVADLNREFGVDGPFWQERVPRYRDFAAVQTLFTEWRSKSPDLLSLAEAEDHVVSVMSTKKEEKKLEEMVDYRVDNLVVNMMSKKLAEKHSHLSFSQAKLLSEVACAKTEADAIQAIENSRKSVKELLQKIPEASSEFVKEKSKRVLSEVLSKEASLDNVSLRETLALVELLDEEQTD